MQSTFDTSPEVKQLKEYYDNVLSKAHLKDLLADKERNAALRVKSGNIIVDFAHTKIDAAGLDMLRSLIISQKVGEKNKSLRNGHKVNLTEDRQVMHFALRCPEGKAFPAEGENVVPEIHAVLKRIADFTDRVRSGTFSGFTGKKLKNVVAIGIGGSFLGPEFVYEALRHDASCKSAAEGMTLKFLANVDPVDFARAVDGLDVEETLFVIISKTFTTAETMLNARTCRKHILDHYKGAGDDGAILGKHLCAVSTNLAATKEFGIDDENVFGFWNWVGGRYSVSSAVGVVPLSLVYGYDNVRKFLDGMHDMDNQGASLGDAPEMSVPELLGLIGFYNTYIAGHDSRAILPYSQALLRFAAHIQQLDMESNGKRVSIGGNRFSETLNAGPIVFGEPGTNGQHSFYQLMHQGRVVPAEFIGFTKSQVHIKMEGEPVSNHDELMSNFFAQADALALGKDVATLEKEGVPAQLHSHKLFEGDRPSISILFKGSLDAFACGQLLSAYEQRVMIEGWLYDINSYDQWGVELGKVLAKGVRSIMQGAKQLEPEAYNSSTHDLLAEYLQNRD